MPIRLLLVAFSLSLTLTNCSCREDVPVEDFKTIHGKIYESMLISDKGQLYDFLDKIFAKSEIERHFDRIGKFQAKKKSDQVKIFIDDIEYKKIAADGNTVTANWIVRGRIHHASHIHQRSLEYEAEYSLRQENSAWKIVSSQIIEHEDFELTDEERELGKTQ